MKSPPDTPRDHREAATGIVRTLRDAGFVAYFAGGCVRDELLGLHPKDYDVATEARPGDVRRLFRRVNEVGARFGVLLVHVRDVTVEVATFRKEGGYSDRRRPDEVEYAGPEEDARRRDFTVNALFLDPLAPPAEPFPRVNGRVIDLVDGLCDLKSRTIRAVGDPDARLSEDDLRSLRAVRFAARLGFTIEDTTSEAIRRHAGELVGVSRERIGDEVRLMLAHRSRAEAAHLMESLDLVKPALDCREGVSPDREGRLLAGLPDETEFTTALAAWAIDRMGPLPMDPQRIETDAKAVTGRLRGALCLSNEERDSILGVFRTLARLRLRWESMSIVQQKRFVVRPAFDGAFAIVRVADQEFAEGVDRRIDELSATESGLAPEPLIVGDDLIELGLTPGPRFRGLLDAVYDAQLEGRIRNRSDALAHVERLTGRDESTQARESDPHQGE